MRNLTVSAIATFILLAGCGGSANDGPAGDAGRATPSAAAGPAVSRRPATQPAKPRPWWEVEARNHPPTTNAKLSLFPQHPRLMFRPADDVGLGRSFQHVRDLYRDDATFKAIFDKALAVDIRRQDPAMLAACWIVTGEDRYAVASIDRMVAEQLGKSGEPYYSNIFLHALAYDWLFHHPYFTAERKKAVIDKMVERLRTELDDLDDEGMAAWHGRSQAANGVIISALALGDLPGMAPLLRRAAGHYLSSLRDMQFSEGWPEGASYWIYNRAGPWAMGADCVMTALGVDTLDGINIRDVMRTIGFWQLYQFAPNQVFEPYGDSAGSLTLGQTGWWELTTDHYARLSRDPALMAGADYLRNRSPDPYGRRPYYWRVAYTYEPSLRPAGDGYDPARPELWMRKHLPQARLFGRDSYGVAFFRGDWGDPNETYATFKAGDLLAHHDHYDTGHFGIQKGGNLTPRTGVYGAYFGPHRLGYFAQSVSKNTLLIMAPGETGGYLSARYPQVWTSLNGGQRLARPTSFNCVGLDHFKQQLNAGPHLERATITAFESVPGELDYIAADITAAYNSTVWAEPGQKAKVSRVTRQFLYLRPEQAFVVFDRVDTTDASYLPKFLLHANSKPASRAETLLVADTNPPTTQSDAESGIYATTDRTLTTEAGDGRLTQIVLLPEQARTLKVGGPKFCFYVETDGDASDGFDGVNVVDGAGRRDNARRWTDQWRVEVEPAVPHKQNRFCNVLLPRLAGDASPLPKVELLSGGDEMVIVRIGGRAVIFARDGQLPKTIALPSADGVKQWLVLDCPPGSQWKTAISSGGMGVQASDQGVLRFESDSVKLLTRLR